MKNYVKQIKIVFDICNRKLKQILGIPELSQRKIQYFISTKANAKLPARGNASQLSVVIPCFKHAQFLPQTLNSIVNQLELPDEIILVNDKSPDSTLAVISDFKENNQNITVSIIDNPTNIGQAASINKAVESTQHDLIMILNDDDILFPDAIKIIKEQFNTYHDIYLLGSASIGFSGQHEPASTSPHRHASEQVSIHDPKHVKSYRNYNDINMTHSTCTFVKSAWHFVGGYYSNQNERLAPFSDRDFQLRINCFFKIGILYDTALSLWRSDSSVDKNLNS